MSVHGCYPFANLTEVGPDQIGPLVSIGGVTALDALPGPEHFGVCMRDLPVGRGVPVTCRRLG